MNKSIFLALLLALSACQSADGPADFSTAPLAGATLGGDFALTDQNGKPATWGDYKGKFRIVYFGYTFCPDVCPVDVQVIGQAMKQLDKTGPALSAKIQPLFITADPARDDPAALKAFLANFHPRYVGLTGPVEMIDATAKKFGGAITRGKPNEAGAYLVDHARFAALYGPEGQPIAMLPIEQGADATVAELKRWVR